MAFCKFCSQKVLWITLQSGKHTLVNLPPVAPKGAPEGSKLVTSDGDIFIKRNENIDEKMRDNVKYYTSHFATCPKATEARKPKSKGSNSSKNYDKECTCCGATPTVASTGLCGPCCFGEADTIGGNW